MYPPVSYTHLDVYKRQEVTTTVEETDAWLLDPEITSDSETSSPPVIVAPTDGETGTDEKPPTLLIVAIIVATCPVSYTHLDVYKRQGR